MVSGMRVVQVITRLIVGGAMEVCLLGCEGMQARGHEVTLLTGPPLGPEGSLLDRAYAGGYRVEVIDELRREIHPVRDWRAYRSLRRRIMALKPDVVHTHSSKAGIIGRWAAHRAGAPAVVHTIHGLAFTASSSRLVNAAYRKLEGWTAPVTTRIVCVAEAMRQQSLAGGVGRAEQYVTVYAGMRTAPFLSPPVRREDVRRDLGIGEGDVVVGTIARLFHMKGHEDLLAMGPGLCEQFPQARFMWVGDGLLRSELERRIERLGLRGRFVLTGLVPPSRIPELANAMDVVVHPSRREGLALALAQGQLAGKPVVTYDVDGNREGLIDGRTGFLAPAFDCRKLRDSLAVLLEDGALRRRMGEAGREFALARFDADVMIESLERVYREAMR